jgi:HAD superfamily hydrolase (TIGR01509 family)
LLRAIVFDFDGVIANSEPLHFRAYREVLTEQGVELTEQDYYSRYLGYDDVGAFTAIAADRGAGWTPQQIARLVFRKSERMEALERDGSVLFPGARQAIQDAASMMPIAIASGALSAEIRRVLDAAGLTIHFSTIVAAEDTVASKPAPDPYRLVVARLAEAHGPLAPEECVALEDSRWGLESARAAGLRTVGVAQTYDATELAAADLVIPNIQALDLAELQRRFAH